jgi:hypothetical protein
MTLAIYTAFNDGSHLMDGHRAQRHLTAGLGMIVVNREHAPGIDAAFSEWQDHLADIVALHPASPVFLMSPDWFR